VHFFHGKEQHLTVTVDPKVLFPSKEEGKRREGGEGHWGSILVCFSKEAKHTVWHSRAEFAHRELPWYLLLTVFIGIEKLNATIVRKAPIDCIYEHLMLGNESTSQLRKNFVMFFLDLAMGVTVGVIVWGLGGSMVVQCDVAAASASTGLWYCLWYSRMGTVTLFVGVLGPGVGVGWSGGSLGWVGVSMKLGGTDLRRCKFSNIVN